MDGFLHDLRYAWRLLIRERTIASAVVLTLALGIGANTAVFAVVHAVLLRSLPYQDPDRLFMVWEQRPAESNFTNPVSPADFLDWSRMTTAFSSMAAFSATTADLTGDGDPIQVPIATVTATFFDVLGVTPLLGRTFQPGDDVPGRQRVVVLSHALWQQRFGRDPSVVGRTITLNGVPQQVVGVLRPDFEFPGEAPALWTPLVLAGGAAPPPRALHNLRVYARSRSDVPLEDARSEMTRIGQELSARYRENAGHGPNVVPLQEQLVGSARNGLLIVMAAVAFLLLIACTNVASLLLARSAGRRRELAIRAAVGAGRARLFGQSLVESLLLAVLGGGVGLIVGWWMLQVLVVETPPALRGAGLDRARLDVPILLFTAAACLVTTVVAGALPAWQVSRTPPGDSLRQSGGRSPLALNRGLRMALIGGEVALTVLLLIGAGLLTRTFWRVLTQPAGIVTTNRLTVHLTLPRTRYPDRNAVLAARRALDERFAAIPGVVAFGASNNLPLTDSDARQGITVEGYTRSAGEVPVRAHLRIVSEGYFGAAGIVLRDGRLFEARDNAGAPMVVVINETMARRYWPGQSPIGRRVRFNDEQEPWRQVIGVIADVRHWGLDQEVNPELYMPHEQQPSSTLSYVLHTAADPMSIVPQLTARVKAVDPDLPLGAVRTFDEVAARSMAARRWSALLLGLFAALGSALAAAGIYGVMSHVVSLRAGEIGIRLSLGARPAVVLGQVIADAMLNTAVGLVLGLALALGASRLLQSLLFEVEPADPFTFAAAALVVIAVAALAALGPARRAMRVDPVRVLRLT
jgi:putative ABC transport system permease protein